MLTQTVPQFKVAEASGETRSPQEIEKVVEAAKPFASLVGEKVDDGAVARCLVELELEWTERFEAEDASTDKYIKASAKKYSDYAKVERDLRGHINDVGASGLDGYWSRELYQTLETAESVLKGKADATGEPIDLSGLAVYKAEVEAHWKDALSSSRT